MKKNFGKLDFELKFRRPNELQNLDLPVEIRRPNLSLVKTGLTSDQIELEPGSYFVISKMPAGQELIDHVEIKPEKKSTAFLTPDENEESPHESEAVQHFFIADRQKVLSEVESLGFNAEKVAVSSSRTVRIRLFKGNFLSEKPVQIQASAESVQTEKGLLGFEISGEATVAQLLQPDTPPLNMKLPTADNHRCRLFVTNLVEGKYTLDAHLENQMADMLLRYSNKGYFQQTELLGQAFDAEKLLQAKMRDPVAAAVGGYALLRFNELEKLHDWTENLRQWFPLFPDGAAIRGEHLARFGRHKEALKSFLEIEKRGLPIFSDGLSYTVDRLSTYLNADLADLTDAENLKNLLSKLQKFAAYTDFREPLTTFTGLDVSNPSAEPLQKMVEDKKSLDLTNLLY